MIFPNLKVRRIIGNGDNVFNPITAFGANLDFLITGQDQYLMKGIDQSVTNVRGSRDQSVNTYTNIHTSNFSATTDGWSASRGGILPDQDGVFGEDDCLKYTSAITSGAHFISQNFSPTLQVGMVFRTRFRYYIPSSNVDLDGLGYASFVTYPSTITKVANTLDAWTQSEWAVDVKTDADPMYITAMKGTTTSYAGTETDVFWIKDIEVEVFDGNSWVQPTTSAMPSNTETSNKIVTDGVAEYLAAQDGGVSFGSNNLGTLYFRFRDLELDGSLNDFFTFTVAGNASYFRVYLSVIDRIALHVDGVGGVEIAYWDNVLSLAPRATADQVLVFKSNGTAITAFQGKTSLGTNLGTGTHWLNSANTANQASLGANLGTATFFNSEYYCAASVNRVTTVEEDEAMVDWMNAL